jgi:hypothetical protein
VTTDERETRNQSRWSYPNKKKIKKSVMT